MFHNEVCIRKGWPQRSADTRVRICVRVWHHVRDLGSARAWRNDSTVTLDRKSGRKSFYPIHPNYNNFWFLWLEHLKNDLDTVLTSLLSKNKKYKGHWKIISLANTTKIYKSGTWAKLSIDYANYILNKTLPQSTRRTVQGPTNDRLWSDVWLDI